MNYLKKFDMKNDLITVLIKIIQNSLYKKDYSHYQKVLYYIISLLKF